MQEEVWALEAVKLLASKNLDRILNLFDDDSVVHEPFSLQGTLNGIGEIIPFLKVVCDNPGFLFNEKSAKVKDVTAVPSNRHAVRLTVAGPTNYQLEFEFRESSMPSTGEKVGKIKKLRIETNPTLAMT